MANRRNKKKHDCFAAPISRIVLIFLYFGNRTNRTFATNDAIRTFRTFRESDISVKADKPDIHPKPDISVKPDKPDIWDESDKWDEMDKSDISDKPDKWDFPRVQRKQNFSGAAAY